MLSCEQLTQMSEMDVAAVDKSTLVDLQSVTVNTSLPLEERTEQFLKQVGNPYVFLCGRTPVRVTFKKDGPPLERLLETYFKGLKGNQN